jgi:hypothetical protein
VKTALAMVGTALAVTALILLPPPAAAGVLTVGSAAFGGAMLWAAGRELTAGHGCARSCSSSARSWT